MSEREFKSASEAVEFYREQVRTQNGYAMQQRLRAEQAEAECDRLREDVKYLQAGILELESLVGQAHAQRMRAIANMEKAQQEADRLVQQNSEAVLLVARLRQEIEFLKGESPDVFIEEDRT